MKKCTAVLVISNSAFVLIGLGCLLCGVFGEAFWVQSSFSSLYEEGLLRSCKTLKGESKVCSFRKTAVQFLSRNDFTNVNGDHRDVVLLLLLISALLALLSLVLLIFLWCRRKKATAWKCLTAFITIMTSSSAITCLGSMIYLEFKLNETWKEFGRMKCWSYILSWVGAGFLVIPSVNSFILILKDPSNNIVVPKRKMQSSANNAYEDEGIVTPISIKMTHHAFIY